MKTIVITGVSSGLGQAIAIAALNRGHRVVGTLRKEEQRQDFDALVAGRSHGRLLDVDQTETITTFVRSVEQEFGAIDVLVNNAGYGLQGVVEELDLDALRRLFEVNLIGPIALIQAVLPAMRKRQGGHIVNMASMGSIITFPGLSAYHGSKFALLGMNDTLAQEVEELGIKVTAILPGVFSTDWNGRSQEHAGHRISDYDTVLSRKPELNWGNPAALAAVVLDAIEMDQPPQHLLVGPTAVKNVRERLTKWGAEIDQWAALSQASGQG